MIVNKQEIYTNYLISRAAMLRTLKKKEEERVGKAIFNSFCKLAYN